MGWIQPPPVLKFQSSMLFCPMSCSHTMHYMSLVNSTTERDMV